MAEKFKCLNCGLHFTHYRYHNCLNYGFIDVHPPKILTLSTVVRLKCTKEYRAPCTLSVRVNLLFLELVPYNLFLSLPQLYLFLTFLECFLSIITQFGQACSHLEALHYSLEHQ